MRRLACAMILLPGPAMAHDAFGDLGPFYASLLHPLADPLQAALVIGTAAFLAGRPLAFVRVALPVFVVAAALSHFLLGWAMELLPPPLLPAGAAVAAGLAATLPERAARRAAAGLALVAATGALAGLAPDRPPAGASLQPVLGTILGLALIATLAWGTLDAARRLVSPLAPPVVGSWVAAVGLLSGAFVLAPPPGPAGEAPGDSALTGEILSVTAPP
jgi:urease accessory protein